jgi:hypothetical protein
VDRDNATERSAGPRLALLELLDADGRVQQSWDVVAWPVRLGRALDNEIVLHDPHVAAHHAWLDVDADGRLLLGARASRNRVRIEEGSASMLTLAADQQSVLPPLALWHLGASTLRVRRPDDPLPDERAWQPAAGPAPRRLTLALLAALLAWTGATLWLENDPQATWENYLPGVLAVTGGLALWASLWGLLSKLFTRRFVALPHLRVALAYVLAIVLVQAVLSLLSYMLDWPWAGRVRELVAWALAAAMVAHHLRLVLPAHRARVNVALATAAVCAGAWTMASHWQRTDRFFDELYMATLPPPAWRLVGTQPSQALIEDLRTLEAPLAERARKQAAKEGEP